METRAKGRGKLIEKRGGRGVCMCTQRQHASFALEIDTTVVCRRLVGAWRYVLDTVSGVCFFLSCILQLDLFS